MHPRNLKIIAESENSSYSIGFSAHFLSKEFSCPNALIKDRASHRDRRVFAEVAEMQINDLSGKIIQLAIKIHKQLGPGLLESVYHRCLEFELEKENIQFQSEAVIPVRYENLFIETGFKADLIIENRIIVELKSVEKITDMHKAQTLTYLKMTGMELGLLINFKEPVLKNGLHRFINTHENNSVSSVLPLRPLRDDILKEN